MADRRARRRGNPGCHEQVRRDLARLSLAALEPWPTPEDSCPECFGSGLEMDRHAQISECRACDGTGRSR